jgi:long-chain fatty acid transport protein
MKGRNRALLLAAVTLLSASATVLASGFNIYEAGARATALGGAFTATADDGSALFYNPAGIGFLEGTRIDLNVMPILPGSEFAGATPPTPPATGQTAAQGFLIPGGYITHNTGNGLAFGVGVYAPFGLGVEWEDPETWVGRLSSYDVDLATLYFTPAVAMRVHENAAISLGVDVAWSHIELNRFAAIPFGGEATLTNVIDSELKGNSELNITPCFGLLTHLHPNLSFGVMYHAPKNVRFKDRDATLTNVAPAALAPTIDQQIAFLGGEDQKVSTVLKLPAFFSLGIAYQIHERARLEFDAVRFNWSHFNRIVLDFESPTNPDQVIKEDYHDIWQLRWGLDVDVAPNVKAMFGYIHDNTPQPTESISPLLPDADREDFSCGLQYRAESWSLTGSYMAVLFHERSNVEEGRVVRFETTQPAGTYDSIANIFGLSVGLNF